jgi:hypothetical protein
MGRKIEEMGILNTSLKQMTKTEWQYMSGINM